MKGQELLKQYFGYDVYREGQEKIITEISSGRDALCIMPTGAGKSLCYQIPALTLDGITLVISPLVSLMKDQVMQLIGNGVKAAYINSSLTKGQINTAMLRAKAGWYKIIYVAPERLMLNYFLDFAMNANISMVTVDEAHCVSQWGHDFRSSYLEIASFIDKLTTRPILSAFTATATEAVRDDMLKLLDFKNPFTIVTGFDRENLFFSVEKPRTKIRFLLSFLSNERENSSIVYCATRKNVEQVCEMLQGEEFSVTRYHAGLTIKERHQNQEDFVFDRRKIMVATNAFGMGIDKPNVRNVVHYNMPMNIEGYYQEAGRAGRDGIRANCVLLYSPMDVSLNRFLIMRNEDGEADPELVNRNMRLLDRMEEYCTGCGCLREYILNYFGENAGKSCENCGNCHIGYEEKDMTVQAQKIFATIRYFKTRKLDFGKTMLASILKGSKNKRILLLKLDKSPYYGTLKHLLSQEIIDLIQALVGQEYLKVSRGEYASLECTLKGNDEAQKIVVRVSRDQKLLSVSTGLYPTVALTQRGREEVSLPKLSVDSTKSSILKKSCLLERLHALCGKISLEEKIPVYQVFSEPTIQEICRKSPQTMQEFSEISGVGRSRLEKYGERFLEVIIEEE